MRDLFEPVRVGQATLRNRLVMTAMSTGFAGPMGQVTPRLVEYYAARAAGGVGLVTVEEAFIHPQLPHVKNALGVYGDHLISGLEALTRRIHREGASACLQIGLYFRPQVSGFPRFAASSDAPDCDPFCMELNRDEIRYLTNLFADAAQRTRNAGFDAVEIHACHGCLISEFLSPYWNHRRDAYGDGLAGRLRFPLEILAAVRERVGREYPVIFRISGSEFFPGGFTLEDAVAFSGALENGGVAAINVSGGLGHLNHIGIPPGHVPRGVLLPLGKAIKEAVRVPIIVGNSMTPRLAQEAIESGQADLIGLGRPLIADPDWPRKVEQGRLDEIRPCIRCNLGCFGGLRAAGGRGVTCIYNPLAGREFESPESKARSKRRVVVIGGGPAGCEVARVSRLRGHDVVLLEKMDRLGGQFNLAAVAPHKSEFEGLVGFYQNELVRLGVDVRLGREATPEMLGELPADVCVLATGSVPVAPPIPGVQLPHVTTVHKALSNQGSIDRGRVVVVGGGASGLEVADFLSEKGLGVTVVEMLDSPGRDILPGIGVRETLLDRLASKGVRILTGQKVTAILEDAVVVSDRPLIGGGKEGRVPANHVVLAMGMSPQRIVSQVRERCAGLVYEVGDCQNPGNALDAIHAAFDLAAKI